MTTTSAEETNVMGIHKSATAPLIALIATSISALVVVLIILSRDKGE